MRYKLLGPSGLKVSQVCLGAMSFGDAWGFGADEKESHRILGAFEEAGGNFVDTADKYHEGQSEEFVGRFVHTRRDRWVIGTKYTLATSPGDPNAAGNSRKNLRTSLEASLRRLGTDYVDVLWVHAWDHVTPVEEVLRGIDDLVAAGKVLYVALSDAPAWVAAEANAIARLRGWSPFVALQLRYNLLDRTAERELLPFATAAGLSVVAWAPLAAGVLTGKYTRSAAAVDSRRAGDNQARLTERDLRIAREVDAVADEIGSTPARVAIAWLLARSDLVVPVVGARTVEQIEDVLAAPEVELPHDHVARLDKLSAVDLGFPYDLLCDPTLGQMVYGDLEPSIDLPKSVPFRRARQR